MEHPQFKEKEGGLGPAEDGPQRHEFPKPSATPYTNFCRLLEVVFSYRYYTRVFLFVGLLTLGRDLFLFRKPSSNPWTGRDGEHGT